MSVNILDLRLGRIINVTPDVEVEIVLFDLAQVNKPCVFGNFALVVEDRGDLLDVLWAEIVLSSPFPVLCISVNKEDLVCKALLLVFVYY